jgi:hypothetical protein
MTSKLFKSDVITRARTYLKAVGSTGAYSHSQGTNHYISYYAFMNIDSKLLY